MARPLFYFTCRQGISHNITPSRHSISDLKIYCVMCLQNAIHFCLKQITHLMSVNHVHSVMFMNYVFTDFQKYVAVISLLEITILL